VVFSGLLKGLGNFMQTVSEVLDEDEQGNGIHKSGEFSLERSNQAHSLYGVRLNMNESGLPKIEQFGTVPGSDLREPVVDVFDEESIIRIIAEMPGIEGDDVKTDLEENVLTLRAERNDRKYATEITIPAPVKDTIKISCRTGLVEIELEKI